MMVGPVYRDVQVKQFEVWTKVGQVDRGGLVKQLEVWRKGVVVYSLKQRVDLVYLLDLMEGLVCRDVRVMPRQAEKMVVEVFHLLRC